MRTTTGLRGITFGDLSGTAYCVQSAVGEALFRKTGPAAELEAGRCPGASVEDAEELFPSPPPPDDEAAANVRAAIPAIEAYYADNQTYAGITLARLRTAYDSGIEHVRIAEASAETHCVQSTVGQTVVHKAGPASDVRAGACP